MANLGELTSGKFGGNIMLEVLKVSDTGTVRQLGAMNYYGLQLDNANKGLSLISNAMGNLDTDNNGFSIWGKIGLALGVAAIAAIGLGLSCLFGPEMEVAADAIDTMLVGETVGDVLVDDAVEEVTEDVAERVVKDNALTLRDGTKKAVGDTEVNGARVSVKAELYPDGSSSITKTVKKGRYTSTHVENFTPGGESLGTTSKGLKKSYKPGKLAVVTSIGADIGAAGGAMTLNSRKATNETSDFNQKSALLNSGSQQIAGGEEQTTSKESQSESIIQGNQALFAAALQAAQALIIPPAA